MCICADCNYRCPASMPGHNMHFGAVFGYNRIAAKYRRCILLSRINFQISELMSQPKPPSDQQPTVTTSQTADYRANYANSVQVRMSVWDFFLEFGTMRQDTPEMVKLENFQGVYLSPQQAKALLQILEHNLAQYEKAFGDLALEPRLVPPAGPVH